MSKFKEVLFDEWNTWWDNEIQVGDLFLLEEDCLAKYVGNDNGLAKLEVVESFHESYIGRHLLYNYGRLIKVPRGSQLNAARILYGK